MTIILEKYSVPEKGQLNLAVNISAEIKVSAAEARRKVNGYVISHVSNLMLGDPTVELVIRDRVYWRVVVNHTLPGFGSIGKVGAIEVDVETGEIKELSPEQSEEMIRQAKALATRRAN